jgi:hypothetical protein
MRERRWIVLSGDGRHVTIGRHTDPTDEQLTLEADQPARTASAVGWPSLRVNTTREASSR